MSDELAYLTRLARGQRRPGSRPPPASTSATTTTRGAPRCRRAPDESGPAPRAVRSCGARRDLSVSWPARAQTPAEVVRVGATGQRLHRRRAARTRWPRWSRWPCSSGCGARWETPANAGISNLHARGDGEGDHRSAAGAIWPETVASLGGKITASGDVDYSGIQATALARLLARSCSRSPPSWRSPPMSCRRRARASASGCSSAIQRAPRQPAGPRLRRVRTPRCSAAIPTRCGASARAVSLERIDHAGDPGVVPRLLSAGAHDAGGEWAGRGVEVIAEARRLFGAQPGDGATPDPPIPPARSAAARRIAQEAQQTQIVVGGLAPSLPITRISPRSRCSRPSWAVGWPAGCSSSCGQARARATPRRPTTIRARRPGALIL